MDFKDSKVGDRIVWILKDGDDLVDIWLGEINKIHDCCEVDYPVEVIFENSRGGAFTWDGRLYKGRDVEIYPASIIAALTPPPKPKKEVVVEGWANFYEKDGEVKDKDRVDIMISYLWKTKELADRAIMKRDRLGEAVHIKHTYAE